MEIDPHILQQIVQRIEQQVRCPQCSKKLLVDFSSLQVMSDDFAIFQLRCDACDAYVVLNASLKGIEKIGVQEPEEAKSQNVSSTLLEEQADRVKIAGTLKNRGSFERLFGRGRQGRASSSADKKKK